MHTKSLLLLTASASLAGLASATPLQGYQLTHPPKLPHDKLIGVSARSTGEDEPCHDATPPVPPLRIQVPARKRTTKSKRSQTLTKRAFVCPKSDDDSSNLLPAQSSEAEGKCVYQSSGVCEYFPGNGTFSSGASNCPGSMVQGDATSGGAGGAGGDTTATVGQTQTQTQTQAPPAPTDTGVTLLPTATQTETSTTPTSVNPNITPTVTASIPSNTPAFSVPGTPLTSAPAQPTNAGSTAFTGMRGPGVVGVLSVLFGILGAGVVF